MQSLITSLRIAVATMLVCVGGYTLVILGIAQLATPETANGSLLQRSDRTIVGSRLIAQKFEQPRYFWPRPSAVDYNAAGAGGSNKSPTSPELTERAAELVARYGATVGNPLPADLAAASGGGLDPHITERAALYQAERVARERGFPCEDVEALISKLAFSPGGPLTPERVVNVLELNLALDEAAATTAALR
ncbi:MAG: potassium-transporting ATPase subunit C [Phycisphaerales bacterium]|nr:potassium-transporting ATPase subunit C [Phycisphaerales bacterium]